MITGPATPARDAGDLFADDADARVVGDLPRDGLGKADAIDGERGAGRHARQIGRPHDERAEPAHLLLEETDGVIEFVAAEGVAADELGETVGLVHRGRPHRPHLVEDDRHIERRRLPGGFAPGQAAADDGDHGQC